MMDELRALYQEVILDHGKNPRNCRAAEDANCHAQGHNPLCGDSVVIHLTVDEGGVIRDAAFEGKGCAISIASASLMTEVLKGKTREEAEKIFNYFHGICTGNEDLPEELEEDEDITDRLQVLSGVREFPMRVKCATLAWHTMSAAMQGKDEISTE
jgi:nitrogen fixation NifU-like protein